MTEIRDVIVVGAGFAGLSAALELQRLGRTVLVLEAQDRVGGRVESRVNGLGERIDTGGQFVCDDMPNVMSLLRAHGNALVRTRFDGEDVAQPPLPLADFEAVYHGSIAIRDRMNQIDPSDPAIAGLTVANWLDAQDDTEPAKAAFRAMIEGLWCLSVADLPLWHLIDNDRRITNEQSELQYFPDATLHALAEDLACELGSALRLSQPVSAIRRAANRVIVVTGAQEIDARTVLVALPPSMAARLAFDPPLPAPLSHALSVWRSGTVIKLVLRYRSALWRDKGQSGVVLWRDPVGLFACDTGRPDRPTLSAFVGGPLALEWRAHGLDWVRDEVLSRLTAALGPEASSPLDVALRDWSIDAWSGGGYSDLIVDMDATDAEATIIEGCPPVHFVSSELSPSFPGYVEGAIVAGRLAAKRVAMSLPDQSAIATSASGS